MGIESNSNTKHFAIGNESVLPTLYTRLEKDTLEMSIYALSIEEFLDMDESARQSLLLSDVRSKHLKNDIDAYLRALHYFVVDYQNHGSFYMFYEHGVSPFAHRILSLHDLTERLFEFLFSKENTFFDLGKNGKELKSNLEKIRTLKSNSDNCLPEGYEEPDFEVTSVFKEGNKIEKLLPLDDLNLLDEKGVLSLDKYDALFEAVRELNKNSFEFILKSESLNPSSRYLLQDLMNLYARTKKYLKFKGVKRADLENFEVLQLPVLSKIVEEVNKINPQERKSVFMDLLYFSLSITTTILFKGQDKKKYKFSNRMNICLRSVLELMNVILKSDAYQTCYNSVYNLELFDNPPYFINEDLFGSDKSVVVLLYHYYYGVSIFDLLFDACGGDRKLNVLTQIGAPATDMMYFIENACNGRGGFVTKDVLMVAFFCKWFNIAQEHVEDMHNRLIAQSEIV